MNFKNPVSYFRLDQFEKEIYQNEIYTENIRRVLYLTIIAIPISMIHIVLFSQKLNAINIQEQEWAKLIIGFHTIIVLVSLLYILISYILKKRNKWLGKILIQIILISLLLMGAAITAADQIIVSAITPFILTSLVVGLVFLIPPLLTVIYYSITYAVFYFAISITQSNPDILVSNQLNGLYITAIGMGLSIILWRGNLTKIKQSKQIVLQNEALREINKEKDKFFSIIAHDLKNPFNSIIGFSQVLEEQLKSKDYTEAQKYVGIIKRSSQLALDLLMNLMEWSRSQTGRMKFKPIYFNLEELIQKATLLYQETSERKSIDLVYQLNSHEDVFADIDMISTVLRNLISNAIKFTHVGGKILISSESTANGIKVSVKDNGMGIPPNKIDELFVVGESHSTSGTNNEKGTGLGLILCKEFIDKNGGEIGVESELERGSTFYFILPQGNVSHG